MAYLKFSRDKRGYEHFYLVQPSSRGKSRPRVLYWFRTPPGVKVGRSPFDPDMRRALEAQNPDVQFDWEAITHTPIPPPVEPEPWRERRRVERAFRESEEAAAIADAVEEPAPSAMVTVEPTEELSAVEVERLNGAEPDAIVDAEPHAIVDAEPDAIVELNATTEPEAASNAIAVLTGSAAPSEPVAGVVGEGGAARQSRQGRRRRRRRGRRRRQVQGPEPDISNPQGPAAIQDSGEPEDENREP